MSAARPRLASARPRRRWLRERGHDPQDHGGPEPRERGDACADRGLGHQRGTRRRRVAAGKGTPATGAIVYEQKCQACHGAKGAGQRNDRLVGGQGTLTSKAPVRTIGSYWPYATTVFDYVRRSMPYIQPQSLTDNDVYAVTAYLLHLNGIIGETDEMNAQTLPKVKMPNQPNFIVVYPSRGK